MKIIKTYIKLAYTFSLQLQFLSRHGGVSLSVQVDIAKMTVGSLIQLACQKLAISAVDAYAILEGKYLDGDEYLSRYAIARDSTIEIRLRAG